ncbi:two-component regulator propeller domain-containing protein [Mucilaginibacter terrae]|uniref:hybrid sensor histidine kinase/response regulator transcription factor n=1 Tax=Mucilaginibacter terrae TaxID=1955052 RepID=UPI0036272FA0
MKKFLFVFLTGLIPLLVSAQHNQYQFSHLSISNGLSNNHVTAILKDSKGFMWFGTVAGLNRFDGLEFKCFRHIIGDSTSLIDDYIYNIIEGPNHKIWVKTKTGFCIFDPRTERFTSNIVNDIQNSAIPKNLSLKDVYKGREQNLILLSNSNHIYLYNPIANKVKHFYRNKNTSQNIGSEPIESITTDSKSNLWLMHNNGMLEMFNPVLNKVLFHLNVAGNAYEKLTYYNTYIDNEDDVWIYSQSAENGIYLFNPSKQLLTHFCKKSSVGRLNSDVINSIVQDNEGLIWIATDHGGINLLNKKDMTVQYLTNLENDSKSLSQNSIVNVYKDNLGIIWSGTFKKGINYYHKNIIKFPLIHHNLSDNRSLPYNDVNRFVEDKKGNLWIGTNGVGLIYFDRQANTYRQFKHSSTNTNTIGNDVIVSLCIDHLQRLWIGSYFGGLDCFDGQSFKHYKHNEADPNSISDDRVWEIMEDSSQRLWVGTLAGGLNYFDEGKNIFYHYRRNIKNSIHSDYVSSIIEDKNKNLWIGTSHGLDVIKKSTGKIIHYEQGNKHDGHLLSNDIRSLIVDSRGLIWIPTREGLSMLNPNTGIFTNFRKDDGLPENNILDVLEDDEHNIWASTTNGLSNIIVTANKKKFAYKFVNYDEIDGLQGLEFNEGASYKTRKGELIFGGANGFNIFYPQNIVTPGNKPKIILTELQLFNKAVSPQQQINGHVILDSTIANTRQISLKYNENVFSIAFTALDFFNPDKVKIRYMLQGFDKNWISGDNKLRKVTYTNLDAGQYKFKIVATNNDAVTGEELNLDIIITPPFWKTTLAYLIYFLAFATTLFLIRRRGIQKIKEEFAIEQEREQAHRLHELDMMKIKFFTNVSHEFRTPLSLILSPVEKLLKQAENNDCKQQLQLINRNARRLLNMVNQLLDFRKMEVEELKLQVKSGDIIKFMEDVCFSFNDIAEKKNISFVFDSDTDSLITQFDHDKIERILFNLLSNAFKFTPEHGHISVLLNLQQCSQGNNLLNIKVIDTGIGIPSEKRERIFERFFQHEVPGSMVNQGSGIGLAITKEFVKLHNGEIMVESELNEGTCFIITLPVETDNQTTVQNSIETTLIHTTKTTASADNRISGRKQSILIVEDNDDFRFYLKDNLKEHFHVVDAINGKEGWQKALALHPSLIISDISMPEMSGTDLCRKLKNDSRTNHIPVILLTALAGEEQHLMGLETGASDYLTKPFNFEILLSKLKNILLQQELMRSTYKKQVELNPTEIVLESPDEKFVQKALQVIEQNISNTEFSVEELSSEMYMSRVTLYKKCLALTGKSPVELIRSVRLKRAAQLLSNDYLTVSQVCYKVGFKSQKYFTKSFKAEFGILPSTYVANNTTAV